MGEQTVKDNGCNFFGYCFDTLKTPNNCACMDPKYYLDKLKDGCKLLDIRKAKYAEYLAEETVKKAKQKKEKPEQRQEELGEKQRTSNAAAIYIKIFDEFEADPLTDKQIGDRLFALTGVRPTNRNISSYRCNYNRGKIKGQTKAPNEKVKRKRK